MISCQIQIPKWVLRCDLWQWLSGGCERGWEGDGKRTPTRVMGAFLVGHQSPSLEAKSVRQLRTCKKSLIAAWSAVIREMNPALSDLMMARFPWAANHVILPWSRLDGIGKALQEQSLKSNGKLCQIYVRVPEMMLFPGWGSPLSRNKSQKCFMLSHNDTLNSALNYSDSD